MDGQQLYPDAAQRMMTIVQAACGNMFTYFLGLPDDLILPEAAFPVIIVDKVSGEYKVGPTTADDIEETVYIHILVDLKTGLGAPDSDNSIKRQLQTFVEGRNPTTGYLNPSSIMYALRTHLTLSSVPVPGLVVINNDVRVSYTEGHYKNMPETREAVVEVTVIERQMYTSRD